MGLPETQNEKDERVEALWRTMNPHNKNRIDLSAFKDGLRLIDHPMKDARGLLKAVVKDMARNGEGTISYEDFRISVEKAEARAHALFQSIDKDKDGKLTRAEVEAALQKDDIRMSKSKLDKFFADIDYNQDGYITWDEWRNFTQFVPIDSDDTPPLQVVLSYYSSAFSLNAEGDAVIREETLEGLEQDNSVEQSSEDELESESLVIAHPSQVAKPGNISQSIVKKSLTDLLPDPGYFAAGGIAGAVSRTATAPLDRLKVYLIANIDTTNGAIKSVKQGAVKAMKQGPGKAMEQESAKNLAKTVGRPLIRAFQELWQAGGMRSLFAGNGLNVVKVMPESAIKFGSYEAAKRALARLEGHDNPRAINPYSQFVAGGVGGIVSQFFVYPLDTLKFRMQCETVKGGLHGNALIVATARKMYQQGGVRSAYRGLAMGIVGMFPYSAIDLATFEFLKKTYMAHHAKILGCHPDDAAPGSFATGCIGAFSGAFGASAVYPLNVLRTRLQAQGTVLHPPTYTGIVDVTRKTIKNEGIRGLFKGLTPNLLKVVPAVSITYVVYENSKKLMHLH